MSELRKIQVTPEIQVSSLWAIPDGYQSGDRNAIILAHGAGNDMDHPFIDYFHHAFAKAHLLSVKFNFPYKEIGRKAPDRMALLERTWRAVIHAVRGDPVWAPRNLYFAGKSMGGRVASHIAAQGEACGGLILLGYPLHPANQMGSVRVAHWAGLTCPVLFVQGTRDALCNLDVLRSHLHRIPGPVTLQLVEGGDHSYATPKSAGRSQEQTWREVALAVTAWMARYGTRAMPF